MSLCLLELSFSRQVRLARSSPLLPLLLPRRPVGQEERGGRDCDDDGEGAIPLGNLVALKGNRGVVELHHDDVVVVVAAVVVVVVAAAAVAVVVDVIPAAAVVVRSGVVPALWLFRCS